MQKTPKKKKKSKKHHLYKVNLEFDNLIQRSRDLVAIIIEKQ